MLEVGVIEMPGQQCPGPPSICGGVKPVTTYNIRAKALGQPSLPTRPIYHDGHLE